MKYKILFFDFDGTLVNTLPDIAVSANYMLNCSGCKSLSDKQIKKYVGNGSRDLVKRCLFADNNNFSEIEIDKALSCYLNYYNIHYADNSYLYPDVIDALKEIDGKTINIIFTNKNYTLIDSIAKKLKIDKYFTKIISPETYNIKKPDPQAIILTQKEYKVKFDEMIMIGDSIFDIQTAKNAGIKSCAVSYGYAEGNDLNAADFIIGSLKDLLKIIE
jgi:phosphoglycolate phosphatase